MNIVIISNYNSPERYIIHEVQKIYPSAIVIEPAPIEDEKRLSYIEILTKLKNLFYGLSFKLQKKLWARALYPDNDFPEIMNRVQILWSELNKQAGVRLLNELKPDILISICAPILKPELIKIPKKAAINLHYGNVPYYRGNDTIFWSLYYKDFDKIAGTIHHLSKGVDSGNILAEVFPELEPSDGQISIEIKTSKLLAESLISFLNAVKGTNRNLIGLPQKDKGRNFKRVERTLSKNLFYLFRRVVKISRPPYKKEEIRTWY